MPIPICCIGCDDKDERIVRGLLSALALRLHAEFVYAAPEQAELRIVDTRQPPGRELIELSSAEQLHHIVALVSDRQAVKLPDAAGPLLRLKTPVSGNGFIRVLNDYAARVQASLPSEPAPRAATTRYYRGVPVPEDAAPVKAKGSGTSAGPHGKRVYRGQNVD